MASLRAVSRVTLGEQVAIQIAEMISEGRWSAGEKLPAEASLCEALNVGRSTLREALKSLAFVGMVRMRPGDGTYVAAGVRGLLDRILARGLLKTEKDLVDVCETRIVLETELAAMAAERATAQDLDRLHSLITQMAASLKGEGRPYIELDLEFHLALATASQNSVLPRLLLDIRGLLVDWIAKSQELPGLRENAQEQHESILKRILARDADGARREMRAHLETFQRAYNLLGRFSDSTNSVQGGVPVLAGERAK
jgi:GntR family transcriptional repressor for pyruvate dehydrogenase complex